MFTGIIETIGTIKKLGRKGNYNLLTIESDKPFDDIQLGESIAVDGCCLTVTAFDRKSFTVEASQETLATTIVGNYKTGMRVNLERALLASGRLGGHIVSGHIDCIANILNINVIGESLEVLVDYPDEFEMYLVPKGSVAINGVSLTVNRVNKKGFSVNLIPHTQRITSPDTWKKKNNVNLEFDILGKYVYRLQNIKPKAGLTLDKLTKSGW
jgi:riboflavin synthase